MIRLFIVLLTFTLLPSCALVRDITGASARDAEALRLQVENEAAEMRAAAAKKRAVLRPGAKRAEVIDAWGSPDSNSFSNGVLTYWYDSATPMYIHFKDDKVIGWESDRAEISRRKEDDARSREIAEQRQFEAQQESRRRKAKAWREFGEAFEPKPQVNCTSNRVGTSTYTNCR